MRYISVDQKKKSGKNPFKILVNDLTYIRVNNKWNYICLFVDVFNRQIVGQGVGRKKNAELVYKALEGTKVNLKKIKIFHSDRGSEFNNHVIDETLIPLEYQGL